MRAAAGPFPTLCVFDLDACLWDKEMFEMKERQAEMKKFHYEMVGMTLQQEVCSSSSRLILKLLKAVLKFIWDHFKYHKLTINSQKSFT